MSDINKLLEVMARLRDPETGCAWDVKQTFSTIAPYTLEEAYEVADAIDRGDMDDLCDELGDLLLQVVFHARMAEELGHFEFANVVEAIVDKMIRRHPHVFGDAAGNKTVIQSADDLKKIWETAKATERASKLARNNATSAASEEMHGSALDGVALNLPALTRAEKIQKRAARVGFDWQEIPPVFDKIAEEMAEVESALQSGSAEQVNDEIGDLLFSVVNLARHCRVDPETALRQATSKFSGRFEQVEQSARERSLELAEQPLSVLDDLWEEAKNRVADSR